MSDMEAYRDVFLAESADYLQQITDGLLALESSPEEAEPVEVIFRGAHSLKGMSAAMMYNATADLAHKMEGLMDRVRKGEIRPTHQVVELMLAAVDLLRDLIDDESHGRGQLDPAEMIAALEAAIAADPDDKGSTGQEPASEESAAAYALAEDESAIYRIRVTLEDSCVLKAVRAYMVIKRLTYVGRVIETIPSAREIEDELFDRDFEVVLGTSKTPPDIEETVRHVSEVESCAIAALDIEIEPVAAAVDADAVEAVAVAPRRRSVPKLSETQTVRVSIGHLDNLVDLVGELVILRSRLERIAQGSIDPAMTETLDELARISTDLQYEVMQTRMVPVGNIFNRFPRMVRDLAVDLGKQVEFEMEGLEIELDRTVLDEIGDPLVHLLRNCIDHGLEPADEREAAGKARTGRVTLSASRERDHIAITVSDDGKGIDPDRVWAKAVQRGIVRPDERAGYSEDDVFLLTCLPGFSTTETATKVSGRGVGMDVVKGKIEHLGGTVRIRSQVGRGTEFVLTLPLTLAIVQSLLVTSRGQYFALPLSSVDEVFAAEDVRVDTIDGAPVVVLRDGRVVPLRRLSAILHGDDPNRLPEPRSSIVLVHAADELNALHVDGLGGRREIVLKPLSKLFRDTKGFSGATILGDGRVMLVLDPRTIFASPETT